MKKCFIKIEFWDKNQVYHYRSMTTSFRKVAKLFKQCRKMAVEKINIKFMEIK